MLADVPAGESPVGGDCSVATVVIPGVEKGDRLDESPGVKASDGRPFLPLRFHPVPPRNDSVRWG